MFTIHPLYHHFPGESYSVFLVENIFIFSNRYLFQNKSWIFASPCMQSGSVWASSDVVLLSWHQLGFYFSVGEWGSWGRHTDTHLAPAPWPSSETRRLGLLQPSRYLCQDLWSVYSACMINKITISKEIWHAGSVSYVDDQLSRVRKKFHHILMVRINLMVCVASQTSVLVVCASLVCVWTWCVSAWGYCEYCSGR